jgi:hypothetical protein
MTQVGYIYIRSHPAYDAHDACKMGKTESIPERDTQYATGEIERGKFEPVFEIPIKQMGIIENLLKSKFSHLNVKQNAGTEFFNKKIITLIEPYLCKVGIQFRKLSEEEIEKMNRKYRIRKLFKRLIQKIINQETATHVVLREEKPNSFSFVPRPDQIEIIEASVHYFSERAKNDSVFRQLSQKTERAKNDSVFRQLSQKTEHNKGLLIIPCGVGKTLISLWITQRLNSDKILVGVPNKLLLKQWEKIICLFFFYSIT